MQNQLTITNLPSPVNTIGLFTVSIPPGPYTVETTSNNVSILSISQGPNPPPVTKTFLYVSPPYSWDDEAPATPYNFAAWVVIQQGTYALLEKWR